MAARAPPVCSCTVNFVSGQYRGVLMGGRTGLLGYEQMHRVIDTVESLTS